MTTRPRTFYSIDSTAVSLREYWWGSPSPAILIAALLKLLRVRLPSSTDDPNVETLAPFETEPSAVPEAVFRHLEPLVRELETARFHSPIQHAIEDDLHHATTHLATFVHESGRAWARVHNRVWAIRTPPKDVLFTEYVTAFDDGTFLWSLSSKPDLAAPPECTVVRRKGASPTELWALHEARLQEEATCRAVVPVRTPVELRASVERHHDSVRNFHLRRGVFAPLTASDLRTAAANARDRQEAAAGGSQHPEILAEIRRLQERKSSWTTGVLVLLVSLALFLGASGDGKTRFAFDDLLILIPLLLFHEGGHWVAMRVFGYRNLQMFFIPFLGAAVSGRHYNVPAWKKAVVSLMGPVPGIVLGAMLGAAGLILQKSLLLRIALTALVLNGFNLLPILPLDGGWVVQAVLASRSVAFEVILRAVAVVALFGWGLFSGDKPLTYLGLFMLLGLPAAYKLARITRDLRRSGLEPVSADDQTIPAATAEVIIAKVTEAFKKAPNKQLAHHTLHVFESLNAQPPGLMASLGLAFAQGASLVAAVVFTVLVAVGQHTNVGDLMRAAQSLPAHALDPASVGVWRSPGSQDLTAAPHNVVVASFGTPVEARAASADLQRRAPGRSAFATLGQTVLLALPAEDDAARQAWLATFQGKVADVFVSTPRAPASVQLSCLAPSAATAAAIEEEASGYFLGNRMHLIPPWIDPDTRRPEERAAHARARRTYARLTRWSLEVFSNPRMTDLSAKMLVAQRSGDTAELTRLRGERERLLAELRGDHVRKLRAEPGVDLAVVDRYEAWGGDGRRQDHHERLSAEIGPLLGQLPLVDGAPETKSAALAATGAVAREGLLLRMPLLRFSSTFEGPLAFLRWLRSQGCTDFRYQFAVGYEAPSEGDEEGG